jgi:hypothetical protein
MRGDPNAWQRWQKSRGDGGGQWMRMFPDPTMFALKQPLRMQIAQLDTLLVNRW